MMSQAMMGQQVMDKVLTNHKFTDQVRKFPETIREVM
jgi:hypothetical protein